MAEKTGSKETIIPVPHRKSYFGTDIPEDSDELRAGAALDIGMAEGSDRGR
jgi:hypothetical protein